MIFTSISCCVIMPYYICIPIIIMNVVRKPYDTIYNNVITAFVIQPYMTMTGVIICSNANGRFV